MRSILDSDDDFINKSPNTKIYTTPIKQEKIIPSVSDNPIDIESPKIKGTIICSTDRVPTHDEEGKYKNYETCNIII